MTVQILSQKLRALSFAEGVYMSAVIIKIRRKIQSNLVNMLIEIQYRIAGGFNPFCQVVELHPCLFFHPIRRQDKQRVLAGRIDIGKQIIQNR